MIEVGSTESVANFHNYSAFVYLKIGRIDSAVSSAARCLDIARRLNTSQCMCYSLECCAVVLVRMKSTCTRPQGSSPCVPARYVIESDTMPGTV